MATEQQLRDDWANTVAKAQSARYRLISRVPLVAASRFKRPQPVLKSVVVVGTTVTFSGTGRAGWTVNITDTASGSVVATATVAANGTWSVSATQAVGGRAA